MSKDKIDVSFNCRKCGEKISWTDAVDDSTEIACVGCGERIGTYGELRETAVNAAKERVDSMLKDVFKR